MQLEPFFARVWLENEQDKLSLLSAYENLHSIANKLWAFSEDEWNSYKHLYKLENFDYILNVGQPDEYSIKVTIDASKLSNQNQFISNLQNLYDMLLDSDVGEYELDGVMISIKNIKVLPTEITAANPKFNYNLLTVY